MSGIYRAYIRHEKYMSIYAQGAIYIYIYPRVDNPYWVPRVDKLLLVAISGIRMGAYMSGQAADLLSGLSMSRMSTVH